MPVTDKKPTRKASTDQKKVAKLPSKSAYDVTVKDCLNWPSSTADSSKNPPPADSVYMSLRSQKQLKEDLEIKQHALHQSRVLPKDGSAIEALRGWPRPREQQPETNDDALEQEFMTHYNDSLNAANPAAKQMPPAAKPNAKHPLARKPGSSKSFKRVVVKEPDDVHVGDLLAQRYLHEYVEQRQADEESERLKHEATDREAKHGRRAAKDRRDIKANKAAQLRAIALADRVESDPQDLWKMDRFTKNARPHLSTFRNGSTQRRRSGETRNNRGDGSAMDSYEFDHGPCICPEKPPFYYGDDVDHDDVMKNDGDMQLQSLTNACDSFTL